jgi:hypothetical protein
MLAGHRSMISLNGGNPTNISLGATITGPQDLNLGLQLYIDGAPQSAATIDTSKPRRTKQTTSPPTRLAAPQHARELSSSPPRRMMRAASDLRDLPFQYSCANFSISVPFSISVHPKS